MLTTILIVLLIALILFFVAAFLQPNEFRVTRSATMSAPVTRVFEQVNNFHHWDAWSPWAKLDLAMTHKYDGAPAGVGAIYSWSGNNKVGEGRTTILDSQPNEFIRMQLEFFRPFRATNTAEFTFRSEGDQTKVTWTMFGKNKFISKAVGLLMNCEKMVGSQFEKGLTQMKAVVEKKYT